MAITAGYDVGGAHLKVALAEDGRTIAVRQIPCPLWRGMEQLDAALVEAVVTHRPRRAARRHHDRRAVRAVPRPANRRARDPLAPRRRAATQTFASTWACAGSPIPRRRWPSRASVGSMNFLASAALVAPQSPRRAAHRHGLDDHGHHSRRRRHAVPARPHRRGPAAHRRTRLHGADAHRRERRRPARQSWRHRATARRRRLRQHGRRAPHPRRAARRRRPARHARRPRHVGRGKRRALRPLLRPRRRRRYRSRIGAAPRAISPTGSWPMCAPQSTMYWRRRPLPGAPIVAAGIGAAQVETIAHALGRPTLRFGTLANAAPDCAEWATRCAPAVAVALLA